MADDPALYQVGGVLRDVGSVVADALQMARYQDQVDGAIYRVWLGQHLQVRQQLPEDLVAQQIDFIIAPAHIPGLLDVALYEGSQRILDHALHQLAHARNVYQRLQQGHRVQMLRALSDVDGLIVDALQVVVDLHHRGQHAQISRHRLVRCHQVQDTFLHLYFPSVDSLVAGYHICRQFTILFDQRRDSLGDGLLDGGPHVEELALELSQHLIEVAFHPIPPRCRDGRQHHPNRPVT